MKKKTKEMEGEKVRMGSSCGGLAVTNPSSIHETQVRFVSTVPLRELLKGLFLKASSLTQVNAVKLNSKKFKKKTDPKYWEITSYCQRREG